MSVDNLKKQISGSKIKTVYLFFGPEKYLINYYTEKISGMCIEKGSESFNRMNIAEKATITRLFDECDILPVFSEKRVVVIKKSNLFSNSGNSDEIVKLLESIPENSCFIFQEEKVDKRQKGYKYISKMEGCFEFEYLKPVEKINWAVRLFNKAGKDIDKKTAALLVDYCEESLDMIHSEINKLILLTNDCNSVTVDDIKNSLTKTLKAKVYELTDSILQGNSSVSIKILSDMIDSGEPIQKILIILARQIKQIIDACKLIEKGYSSSKAAAVLGVHPYVTSKLFTMAKRLKYNNANKILKLCLKTDVDTKTGNINGRLALELLIEEISTISTLLHVHI